MAEMVERSTTVACDTVALFAWQWMGENVQWMGENLALANRVWMAETGRGGSMPAVSSARLIDGSLVPRTLRMA